MEGTNCCVSINKLNFFVYLHEREHDSITLISVDKNISSVVKRRTLVGCEALSKSYSLLRICVINVMGSTLNCCQYSLLCFR